MKGPAVMIPGLLFGMKREATCHVLTRQQSPDLGADYVEGFIINAPPDLPDGEYLVVFDRHTLRAFKDGALWLSSGPIVRESR